MTFLTGSISKKLLSIIILGMLVITLSITAIISITNQKNLSEISVSRLNTLASLVNDDIEQSKKLSTSYIKEELAKENNQRLLTKIAMLGPLYSQTASTKVEPIKESEQMLNLHAQLQLAQQLSPRFIPGWVTELNYLYKGEGVANISTLPLLHVGNQAINTHVYEKKFSPKTSQQSFSIKHLPSLEEVFHVDNIYKRDTAWFLSRLSPGYEPSPQPSKEEAWLTFSDQISIEVSLPNPKSWAPEQKTPFLLKLTFVIDKKALQDIKNRIGSELLITKNDQIIMSTSERRLEFTDRHGENLFDGRDHFLSGSAALNVLNGQSDEYRIITLKPISEITSLNDSLLEQILIAVIACALLVCFAFFFAIRSIIAMPIGDLTSGVKMLANGSMNRKLPVKSSDEISVLSMAFNDMAYRLEHQQQEIKAYQKDLESLVAYQNKELDQKQQQLMEAEKMSALGEMVASVSHEINTPLGICVTAESFFRDETNLLKQKFEDGQMSRADFSVYIDQALENCDILAGNLQRTADLVKNFKQIAVDQCIEEVREVQLYRYIEDLLTTIKPRFKKTRHKVLLKGDKAILVNTAPGAISQIVTNLIMNSILHGFEGTNEGEIEIDLKKDDESLKIIYRDNGNGMNEETRGNLFKSFYTTKKGAGGTGLGMSIIKTLVEKDLNGSISFETAEGEGVRFEICLPLN